MVISSFAHVLVNNLPREVTFANNNMATTEVSPTVVMFGSSQEELAAKNQIFENFPNSILIDFSDIEMIYQNSNLVIYIGHSSKEGIAYNDRIIEWEDIAIIIKKSISNDHFILGCDSETITSLTASTGKNVVSFDTKIDAIVGASFISVMIAFNEGIGIKQLFKFYNQYNERIAEIRNDPSIALLLPVLEPGGGGGGGSGSSAPTCDYEFVIKHKTKFCVGITSSEFPIHALTAVAFILAILTPLVAAAINKVFKIATTTLIKAGYAVVAFSHLMLLVANFITFYDDYNQGDDSILEFAANLISLVGNLWEVVKYIGLFLSPLDMIEVGILFVGDTGAKLVPAVIVTLIVLTVVTFLIALDNYIRDLNDV